MKIEDTVLCLNCEEVFRDNFTACPGCGSRHYFPLAKWLNRKPLREEMGKTRDSLCVGSIEEQFRVIRIIINSIVAKIVNKEYLNDPISLS